MGMFSSSYENAGVGIAKNERKKKGIVRFFELLFRKIWKIIQVNILYSLFFIPVIISVLAFFKVNNTNILTVLIILCLGVFTVLIGPATASMLKILRNYTLEKHAFIVADFKECFTKNFKKSSVVGIIDTILIISIAAGFYVYPQLMSTYDNKLLILPFIISMSVAIMIAMMNFYAYLMIISTDLSFKNIIKNSFALACIAFKKNILTLIISLIIIGGFVLLILYNLNFMFLLPFIPASIIGFIVCFNSYPIIQKYVINPYYEKIGEVNPELDLSENDDNIFEDKGGSEKPIVKNKRKNKTIK